MEFTTEMLETVFKTVTEDHYNGNTTSQSNMTEDRDGEPSTCTVVDDTNVGSFLYSDYERIMVTVVMPIIAMIGVTGNAVIIYAFLRVKVLRTVTNYYLVSLAVADLSFLCLVVGDKLAGYSNSPLPDDSSYMGEIGCKAYVYTTDTLFLVSCFLIMAVSFDRYLAICWPFKFRALRKPSSAVVVSFACWLMAALIHAPKAFSAFLSPRCFNWMISRTLPDYPKEIVYCVNCNPKYQNCFILTLIDQIGYSLIAPYLSIVYLLIIRELRRQTKSTQESATLDILQRNKSVVRMLVITVLVYAICTVPFRILNLLGIYDKLKPLEAYWPLLQAVRISLYINSAANPIIYSLTSQFYRKCIIRAFLHPDSNQTPQNLLEVPPPDPSLGGCASSPPASLATTGL